MSAFTRWVDGEAAVPLHAEFKPIKEKKPNKKHKHASLGDRQRLDGFLKLYVRCAVVISVLMLIVLLIGAVGLCRRGDGRGKRHRRHDFELPRL